MSFSQGRCEHRLSSPWGPRTSVSRWARVVLRGHLVYLILGGPSANTGQGGHSEGTLGQPGSRWGLRGTSRFWEVLHHPSGPSQALPTLGMVTFLAVLGDLQSKGPCSPEHLCARPCAWSCLNRGASFSPQPPNLVSPSRTAPILQVRRPRSRGCRPSAQHG